MSLSSPYNEREVLEQLATGDERAFEIIYREYQPRLTIYLLPFTRNSSVQTEEIIQNIFLKLWMRRETLPIISNFSNYLFRMARNQYLDEANDVKVYDTAVGSLARQQPSDNAFRSPVHESVIFGEYAATAKEAIEALSPQRRRIFFLRYEKEMTLEQIAQLLKIAKPTVKNHLYEGVKFIKDYMREHGDLPILLIFLLSQSHHSITSLPLT